MEEKTKIYRDEDEDENPSYFFRGLIFATPIVTVFWVSLFWFLGWL